MFRLFRQIDAKITEEFMIFINDFNFKEENVSED